MTIEIDKAAIHPLALEALGRPFAVDCFESDMIAAVDSQWRERPVNIQAIPSEMPKFKWFTEEEWAAVRQDPRGYWCHDAAIIRDNNGTLEVMVCVRSLTGSIQDGTEIHSTPIEGWLWLPGGRNQNDCSPSREFYPAEPSNADVASLLKVLNRETGLSKNDCIGAWNLGLGKTYFPENDIYKREDCGVEFIMEHPQLTHNAIYIIQVGANFIPEGRSIENLRWISQSDYQQLRTEFCPYMQDCLDAIFAGAGKAA